ncbi:DUF4326 domain-containing protein [Nocardia wallacei]|uniref:DUF4326 domain-containing protein n=1 Tax=Nocardia wallacei TaxID=480035 RepID=UPI0024550E06|nr:DUF4326 domain-containing protein [Nocardia wallacei]
MPERIQLRRTAGWRKPEGALVVARPSRWGNPFRLYREHHIVGPAWNAVRANWGRLGRDEPLWTYISSSHPIHVGEVVYKFRVLMEIRQRDEPDRLREWLAPLRGHDLACWCPLDQPCHATVLLELANAPEVPDA